ncbi:hypothetical protein C2857_004136 [Epichloe festucae Fl1]|uniref:Uncharacterized protein n=1 Tax=Epichloe festucae (strain Fl1) TaxID=877507 RepID=A0A7S9KUX3_EPIFF|nr:hypothetical protein C2857_004136 [Epichloe festucae Fl1]
MTFKTLNLALISLSLSLLGIGLTASAQPVDFEASNVVKPGSTFSSWDVDTSALTPSIDKAKVKTRDLEVRTNNFKSPHIQQSYTIQFQSDIISVASWTFDVWFEVYKGSANMRARRPIQTNKDITHEDLLLEPLKLYKAGLGDSISGTATFLMTGYVKQTQKLEVTMALEFWASAQATTFSPPSPHPPATLDGKPLPAGNVGKL